MTYEGKYELLVGDTAPVKKLYFDSLAEISLDTLLPEGYCEPYIWNDARGDHYRDLVGNDPATIYNPEATSDQWIIRVHYAMRDEEWSGVLAVGAYFDCFEHVIEAHATAYVVKRLVEDSLYIIEYRVPTGVSSDLETGMNVAGIIHNELVRQAESYYQQLADAFTNARSRLLGTPSLGLEDMYQRTQAAKGSNAKGRALEDLLVRLTQGVQGFEPKPRIRTRTEEIDISILNRSTDPISHSYGPIILLECKNWTSSCGKNEYVALLDKMRARRQKCSLGVLVSWNGFTRAVRMHQLRTSSDPEVIVLLDKRHLRRAIDVGLGTVIEEEWFNAVHS